MSAIVFAGGGTGGHVFPMISVAEALRQIAPAVEAVFVGTARGMETKVVPERGFALELMNVLPLRGGGVSGAVRGASRAAAAVWESRDLIRRIAPAAVLSIGGYAAGPISLAARVSSIPVALMEPNSVIGLANRLTAPFVQRAYTAFEGAEKHFRKGVVLRAGVPIRDGFGPRPYQRRPTMLRVLVLGGSQGARALNEAVPEALALAETPVRVVHQCGKAMQAEVEARYRALGGQALAEVTPFIEDVPRALADADLVIGRSGASAVSEICAVGRPSLLVPYPFAAGNHQAENARALVADGAAVCVLNDEATPERLAAEIDGLASSAGLLERMAAAARARGKPTAALTVARDLLTLAGLARDSDEVDEDSPGAPRGGHSLAAEAP